MATSYPYRKILIPVDFSPVSERSFRHGLALAGAAGAEVVLLTVVDTSFPYPDLYSLEDPDHDYFKVMRDRALAKMDEWLAELPEASGVTVEKVVGRGRPATEIEAIAEEIGADLIVIARSGASGLRKALMGSTTSSLVRGAPCPILVLPAAGADHRD